VCDFELVFSLILMQNDCLLIEPEDLAVQMRGFAVHE
jgi:hypothetical protein